MRRLLALGVALAFVGACGGRDATVSSERVVRVIDGDTIELAGGDRVRLVQIDAPEQRESECYADAATRVLRRLLPAGTAVELEVDPDLDERDRYGRLLRYVRRGSLNVNVELVRRGAAAVWFYDGVRGRHARDLLRGARSARKPRRGLWRACPATAFDPERALETR